MHLQNLAFSAASQLSVMFSNSSLCIKLYCKCNSLTPGVKQLIQSSQANSRPFSLPSLPLLLSFCARNGKLSAEYTALFNNLYSCVIALPLLALRYGRRCNTERAEELHSSNKQVQKQVISKRLGRQEKTETHAKCYNNNKT